MLLLHTYSLLIINQDNQGDRQSRCKIRFLPAENGDSIQSIALEMMPFFPTTVEPNNHTNFFFKITETMT